jgi:hypothetical protein
MMGISRKIGAILCVMLFLCSISCHAKDEAIKEAFEKDIPSWMLEQIREDLIPFRESGIRKDDLDRQMQIQEEQNFCLLFVRCQVINQQVLVSIPFKRQDVLVRVEPIIKTLKKLIAMTGLPDVDFIVTLHDSLDGENLVAPVFVFAKNSQKVSKSILFPDFDAMSGYHKELEEVQRGNSLFPWHQKRDQAVWRGAMTGGIFTPDNFLTFPRTKMVSLSLEFPNFIDARFTYLTQCENCKRIKRKFSNYFSDFLPIYNHIAFKYQILVDGNSCAYARAYWQLFSNCVILKQDSDSIQWYYRGLQPYVHYIPVKADMSNLVDQIRWARENDEQARAISQQAQGFAQNNISNMRVLQYFYLLLHEYAKLSTLK